MTDFSLLTKVILGLRGSSALPEKVHSDEEHLIATLRWIERAHKVINQKGISKGYDLLRAYWSPAYPETTGYTIPTLINAATILHQPIWLEIAIRLAEYLLNCSNSDGAVVHWQDGSSGKPIVFDTGQVIFGWIAAYKATEDARFFTAANKAANWLASIQDPGGAWLKGQYLDVPKVIDTRVDWALLELNQMVNSEGLKRAAIRNLEWAVSMQENDGWFNHCSFRHNEDPITHTLAYTAEGLVECGILLDDTHFIDAGIRTLDALMNLQRSDGSIAATYSRGWHPTSTSSCLTGNCQLSRLWLLLHATTKKMEYRDASRNALDFVLRTQELRTENCDHFGAIAGSFPIFGSYERTKYPNWAAKFCADALIAFQTDLQESFFNLCPG